MAKVLLNKVTKRYGKLEAVKDLNLICKDKEFLVILGPTGAGKTTTLKMIAGIESISQGEIKIDGKMVNDLPSQERDVSMVFETYVLYPNLTVFENIASPLRTPRRRHNFPEKEIRRRVKKIAQVLEIGDLLNRMPAQLSGGQRQRVGLARALVRQTTVTLMDEPIAHLDAKLRNSLRGELKRWQKDNNLTIIYTTHDYIEALGMGDKIAVLNKGKLEQVGTPKQVYNSPANEFVGLNIGYPPINIFRAHFERKNGQLWVRSNILNILLPENLAQKVIASIKESEVKVGIRPSNVKLH
ncbi:MAG: ABC transporter ATP-binding protein, partial [Candidatus Aerophobetes bacterium]|nr:ABC transporter ATP-binding protein [Candidatus Aerophobetes bacterium]